MKKHLTILHSNDIHGDFTAEKLDDIQQGGIPLLSGYVQQVRRQEENVLYVLAGDMFCGSLIDQEYRGISTIDLMNMMAPDIATLGNHEVDYGIAHLLFLEKCARFPIINANLYIKSNNVRLFQSHEILEVGGIRILFIGVITEEVLSQTRQEAQIGALVDVRDAAKEVGRICNAYRTEDIDLTVLLTHIGVQADQQLAALLDPEWGVDMIIGGHSHTFMEEPCVVAGIPIVQAGTGTDQIGRFDITVDMDKNEIADYTWQLVPINNKTCVKDEALEGVLHGYETTTEKKYSRYVTRFADRYTHPARNHESEMGRLFADVLRDALDLDIMLLGSGAMRRDWIGPIVTYRDLMETFPYNEAIYRVSVTGAQLKHAIRHIFRSVAFTKDAHTEYYQYSGGLQIFVNDAERTVENITFEGEPIEDERMFRMGIHKFHFTNMEEFLGLCPEEIKCNQAPRVVATETLPVLEEWLSSEEMVHAPTDPRWIEK